MTAKGPRPHIRLRRYRRGEILSASHLNEGVDVLQRLHNGVYPAEQVRARADAAPMELALFKVVAVGPDYIRCERQGGEAGSASVDGEIRVAKPPLLRRTPYEGTDATGTTNTRDGITFVYSTDSARVATKTSSGQTEDQVIVPSYLAGDLIVGARGIKGGTGALTTDREPILWVDMNLDGRAWGQA